MIGAREPISGDLRSISISVNAFRGGGAANVGNIVKNAALKLAKAMNRPGQPILLCRGTYFDDAEAALKEAGYETLRGIVEDPLQGWLKERLFDDLSRIGVPIRKREDGSRGGPRVDDLIDWVADDYKHRERYVKTAYRCWREKHRKYCRRRAFEEGSINPI